MTPAIETTAVAVREERAVTLLEVIAQAARDPNVDVAKMERLVALRQQITKHDKVVSFP